MEATICPEKLSSDASKRETILEAALKRAVPSGGSGAGWHELGYGEPRVQRPAEIQKVYQDDRVARESVARRRRERGDAG